MGKTKEKKFLYKNITEEDLNYHLFVNMPNILEIKILSSSLLKVSDKVCSLSFLLDTGKNHLGTRDVLFGVNKVSHEGFLLPCDSLRNVGGGV